MSKFSTHLLQVLREIGLNETEASVYLASLSIGAPQTSGTLAKRAELKGTTATMALKQLQEKGLVSNFQKGSIVYYCAENPDSLLEFIERKRQQLNSVKTKALPYIDEIHKMIKEYSVKPKIRVFEGAEGIKHVFLSMMNLGNEILGYTSLDDQKFHDLGNFWPQYFKLVKSKKKKVRIIAPDTPEGKLFKKRDKAERRETLLVDSRNFVFASEKHIVGDTIAHINLHKDALIAVVIQDKYIAETEKAFFNLTWSQGQNGR